MRKDSERGPGFIDYRDDHSADIALLLTVARAVRALFDLVPVPEARHHIKALDDALKPFEHYPNPVDQLQDETQANHDAAKEDREWTGA